MALRFCTEPNLNLDWPVELSITLPWSTRGWRDEGVGNSSSKGRDWPARGSVTGRQARISDTEPVPNQSQPPKHVYRYVHDAMRCAIESIFFELLFAYLYGEWNLSNFLSLQKEKFSVPYSHQGGNEKHFWISREICLKIEKALHFLQS